MDSNKLIWLGMVVGSTAGSFIPALWGGSLLSLSSIFFSGVGAIAGVWAMYKITH